MDLSAIRTQRTARYLLFAAAATATILAAMAVCCRDKPPSDDPPSTPRQTAETVRLLVVDDPALAAAIEQQWSADFESKLEVTETTASEIAGGTENRVSADAVIYPSFLLGALAERGLIVPLPDTVLSHPRLAYRDILPMARLRETKWASKTYALPFGSPQFTLYYRPDLFGLLEREPPETWAEYQELAELVARRDPLGDLAPAEDAEWFGSVEPLGPGWAGQMLLARSAPYARHRSYYSTLFDFKTMEPLIAGEPFVRALEELVAAAKVGPPESDRYAPEDVRRCFYEGKCAMAITWPSAAETGAAVVGPGTPVAVAFAELPGSDQVYHPGERTWQARLEDEGRHVPLLSIAGRLGSVASQSRRARAAFNVLMWLSGKELSGRISPHSPATTLYRKTHLQSSRTWLEPSVQLQAAKQYARLVAETQHRPAWLMSLRIPGRSAYLAALDQAVQAALTGELSAKQALEEAASSWGEITQQLGVEEQARAYQHSLNLEL